MKWATSFLIFSVLILLAACTSPGFVQQGTQQAVQQEQASEPLPDPQEFILTKKDMVGWELEQSNPRSRETIPDYALDFGWQKGYYTQYQRAPKEELLKYTRLQQFISVYNQSPVSLATDPLEDIKTADYEATYLPFDDPGIGDASTAYQVYEREINPETNQTVFLSQENYFLIKFAKDNILQTFHYKGTQKEYAEFLEFVRKAEKK